MSKRGYDEDLLRVVNTIVANSQGRARLAFGEDDTIAVKVGGAGHFLKVDGKRVGADIELYKFLGDTVEGWGSVLGDFLKEVLLPVRFLGLTDSYVAGSALLLEMGHKIFPTKMHAQWDALF